MPRIPSAASTTNHTKVTGPKTAPTLAVPRRWKRKSPTRITSVPGTTKGRKRGVATSRPSIALSTEMAGVIMPSP